MKVAPENGLEIRKKKKIIQNFFFQATIISNPIGLEIRGLEVIGGLLRLVDFNNSSFVSLEGDASANTKTIK